MTDITPRQNFVLWCGIFLSLGILLGTIIITPFQQYNDLMWHEELRHNSQMKALEEARLALEERRTSIAVLQQQIELHGWQLESLKKFIYPKSLSQ